MSWKSIVTTGLLCVVASPALAAPGFSSTLVGLDAQGRWYWDLSVDPDDALFTNPADHPDRGTGGSVAAELTVTASQRDLVSMTQPGAMATDFDFSNLGYAPA